MLRLFSVNVKDSCMCVLVEKWRIYALAAVEAAEDSIWCFINQLSKDFNILRYRMITRAQRDYVFLQFYTVGGSTSGVNKKYCARNNEKLVCSLRANNLLVNFLLKDYV